MTVGRSSKTKKEIKDFTIEFNDALIKFIEEWTKRDDFSYYIAINQLIGRSKCLACECHEDYFKMLGLLTTMLSGGLIEMHAEIRELVSKLEDEETGK
jgi:hypothetical protein